MLVQGMGIGVMVVGVAGIIYSTYMEVRLKEPIYALLMKIFPVVFAVGIVLFSLK